MMRDHKPQIREGVFVLDWLARNLHEWPAVTPKIIPSGDDVFEHGANFCGDYVEIIGCIGLYTKDKWIRRRRELGLEVCEMNDLDWLARNVHKWPAGHQGWLYIITNGDGTKGVATSLIGQVNCPWVRIEIQDWLARRAELQNKPSWDLSGSWSKYLAQDMDGEWKWLGENPSLGDEDWTADELRSQCKGVVIGDWRDTLERRPAELSEQAVTERLAETTKIVLAAAPALMDEKFSFDRNDWHERGELPPVGTRCEALITSERQWVEIEVVCHRDGFALGWCPKERCGYHGDEPTDFRPIRTERDLAVDEMKRHCPYHGSWETTYKLFAEALYDAGYRAGGAA